MFDFNTSIWTVSDVSFAVVAFVLPVAKNQNKRYENGKNI